nr:DUF2968 domain-containing protein [Burkholderia ambifaria]
MPSDSRVRRVELRIRLITGLIEASRIAVPFRGATKVVGHCNTPRLRRIPLLSFRRNRARSPDLHDSHRCAPDCGSVRRRRRARRSPVQRGGTGSRPVVTVLTPAANASRTTQGDDAQLAQLLRDGQLSTRKKQFLQRVISVAEQKADQLGADLAVAREQQAQVNARQRSTRQQTETLQAETKATQIQLDNVGKQVRKLQHESESGLTEFHPQH